MIGAATHGAPNWVDLSTSDVEAAIAFYATLLGWAVSRHDTPMGMYAIGTVGDLEVAGMMQHVPAEVPAYWSVYFGVGDLDAAVERTTGLGGSVIAPPMDAGGQRFVVLEDPQGAVFSLLERPTTA